MKLTSAVFDLSLRTVMFILLNLSVTCDLKYSCDLQ